MEVPAKPAKPPSRVGGSIMSYMSRFIEKFGDTPVADTGKTGETPVENLSESWKSTRQNRQNRVSGVSPVLPVVVWGHARILGSASRLVPLMKPASSQWPSSLPAITRRESQTHSEGITCESRARSGQMERLQMIIGWPPGSRSCKQEGLTPISGSEPVKIRRRPTGSN
jgi:hypothetical protein